MTNFTVLNLNNLIMANVVFNVNTNASIILTAKLERLNKSAFP